jgi:hypothetical protein
MLGTPATLVEINCEIFVAELIEAALNVAGKHETYASSREPSTAGRRGWRS